eukprot:GHVT01077831.1.p1 GENE.GHVT01077831.1~~GHVT01077831.1.p1  ORF type:complete len:139 (+),score=3.65 GHVT01077831.1:1108-1524(+)
MNRYQLICKKGEGTFSEVIQAQSTQLKEQVAMKVMKSQFKSIHQVNNLPELQALRALSPHPHIVKLYESVFDENTGNTLTSKSTALNIRHWAHIALEKTQTSRNTSINLRRPRKSAYVPADIPVGNLSPGIYSDSIIT